MGNSVMTGSDLPPPPYLILISQLSTSLLMIAASKIAFNMPLTVWLKRALEVVLDS